MAFNPNELILDRVRTITMSDIEDGRVLAKVNQAKEVELTSTTEADEIQDALGSTITKLYKGKKGTLTYTNALYSTDLSALQYGKEKFVGTVVTPKNETLTVTGGKVELSATPKNEFKYVYVLASNNIAETLEKDVTAGAGKFSITGKEITFDSSVPDGSKVWIKYDTEVADGVRIDNETDKFPSVIAVDVEVIFRDPCTEKQILGHIVSSRAKINPEDISLSMTRDGGHKVDIDFNKDYCSDTANLYSIILSE